MNKRLIAAALAMLLASGAGSSLSAAPQKSTRPALKVGDVAPDFTLDYFTGNDLKKMSLHDFKGKKNVMIGFYIFAFTGG